MGKKNRKLQSNFENKEELKKRKQTTAKNNRRTLNQKLRLSSVDEFDSDELTRLIYEDDC